VQIGLISGLIASDASFLLILFTAQAAYAWIETFFIDCQLTRVE